MYNFFESFLYNRKQAESSDSTYLVIPKSFVPRVDPEFLAEIDRKIFGSDVDLFRRELTTSQLSKLILVCPFKEDLPKKLKKSAGLESFGLNYYSVFEPKYKLISGASRLLNPENKNFFDFVLDLPDPDISGITEYVYKLEVTDATDIKVNVLKPGFKTYWLSTNPQQIENDVFVTRLNLPEINSTIQFPYTLNPLTTWQFVFRSEWKKNWNKLADTLGQLDSAAVFQLFSFKRDPTLKILGDYWQHYPDTICRICSITAAIAIYRALQQGVNIYE
jgi:hypothetical protein